VAELIVSSPQVQALLTETAKSPHESEK
jgi:hypothetical protein